MILKKLLSIFIIASVFSACSSSKHLKEEEKLLKKTKLVFNDGKEFEDELSSLVKQKPNRKFLGLFKLYLGIYNLYYNKEDSRIKEKIGEPPAVLDTNLSENSAFQMKRFLQNRGFYEAEVVSKHELKQKKANVYYHINKGNRYRITQFNVEINDPVIEGIFNSMSTKEGIKVGDYFDVNLLNKERERIENLLKSRGYYKFSKEFVVFEADTFKANSQAHLRLKIKNIVDKFEDTDSLTEKNHEKYRISIVKVTLDQNQYDIELGTDSINLDSILFVKHGTYDIKTNVLTRSILIRPGQLYDIKKQERTYGNLSALGVFSLVSIQFEEDFDRKNKLIVNIDLSTYEQKSLSLQAEGTNNGGNLGVNSNLIFQNKNTFHGAERLTLRFRGGLEVQQLLTEDDDDDLELAGGFLPFNTFEFGPELSLEVPRFMIPFFSPNRFSAKGNPRTTFSASYNYQERPDYRRNVSTAFIAYSWNETPTKTHIIQPIDLSYIRLDPSEEFASLLNSIQNPFLRNSYTDNLILALKYSFIFNNQAQKQNKNHVFFRANAESAGNLISTLFSENQLEQNEDGSLNLAGIRYAQYIRSDIDFRYYQNLVYNNKMVYRIAAGVGLPYGNSSAMPFEKSFFAGGANNIRAWRARELGPGALPDSSKTDVDQIGNMQLIANLEFRFPLSNLIEGATFLDAGNIWNLDQEDSRESTEFQFSTLWRGTALGLGAGVRLNFSFFILRFDVATPIKDPSESDPFLIQARWRQTNLNFGIGYPF